MFSPPQDTQSECPWPHTHCQGSHRLMGSLSSPTWAPGNKGHPGKPRGGKHLPGSPSTGKATEKRRPKDTGVGQPGSCSSVRPGRALLSTCRGPGGWVTASHWEHVGATSLTSHPTSVQSQEEHDMTSHLIFLAYPSSLTYRLRKPALTKLDSRPRAMGSDSSIWLQNQC